MIINVAIVKSNYIIWKLWEGFKSVLAESVHKGGFPDKFIHHPTHPLLRPKGHLGRQVIVVCVAVPQEKNAFVPVVQFIPAYSRKTFPRRTVCAGLWEE